MNHEMTQFTFPSQPTENKSQIWKGAISASARESPSSAANATRSEVSADHNRYIEQLVQDIVEMLKEWIDEETCTKEETGLHIDVVG